MLSGISPVNVLKLKSSAVRLGLFRMEGGNGPSNRLWDAPNDSSRTKLDISFGKDPVNKLPSIYNSLSSDNLPTDLGIDPLILFSCKLRISKELKAPISSRISPWTKLLSKLISVIFPVLSSHIIPYHMHSETSSSQLLLFSQASPFILNQILVARYLWVRYSLSALSWSASIFTIQKSARLCGELSTSKNDTSSPSAFSISDCTLSLMTS